MEMRGPEDLGLTRAEWSIILDAMNGHLNTPGMSAQDEIEPNIEDHIALNRADLAHGAHGDVLLTKIKAFSAADWDIVMSVVEGFWKLSPDVRQSRIPGDE